VDSQTIDSYPTPWLNQAKVLFWRTALSLSRNPADALGRLLLSLWVGIILGWVLTRRSGRPHMSPLSSLRPNQVSLLFS
jgi:hypothetical protein